MPQRDVGKRIAEQVREAKNHVIHEHCAPFEMSGRHPGVQRACELAGVDSSDPRALEQVFIALASACFGQGKPGRSQVWNSAMLSSLLLKYVLVVANAKEKMSQIEICKEIEQRYPYFGVSAETLRARLYDATNPVKNDYLRDVLANVDEQSHRIKAWHQEQLPDWKTLAEPYNLHVVMYRRT